MSRPVKFGSYKICPTCGESFYVVRPWMYAYKRNVGRDTLFFCCYSHKRTFDMEHDLKVKENRKNGCLKKKKGKNHEQTPAAPLSE